MDAFLITASDPTTFLVLAVILCAVIVRSALGFGDVLVSVPILSLFVSPKMVIPLMGLVGATNALLILLRERRAVHWRPVRYLLMASFVGVPLGVWLLKWMPETTISLALGMILVAFCGWSLFGRKTVQLRSPLWAWPFGFGAGVMGGAVTATGPPIVLYSATQGWTPEESRATMQGFFFPNSVFILSSHWWADMWTKDVINTYIIAVPICIFALPIGAALAVKMSRSLFEKLTLVVLFAAGLLLIWG